MAFALSLNGYVWAAPAPSGSTESAASKNDSPYADTLPELSSGADKHLKKSSEKDLKEQASDYFTSSATQGFENLTPEALESQARGYVKNKATSTSQAYLEELLSPYGSVRTNLSIDDKGNLEGSSLDYFVPWYDNQRTVLFNQFSIQRKEDRTISNIGFGGRQNVGEKWLLGANVFYDRDLSRDHERLGIGGEAWTDYLKLSANYYHPLSDWKDSKDFDFYEERPARGWDMRSEAYLPFYPQLGGKLVYEQYYGDEVALFGKDNLQKDPHAVTVGVNYTPVPLVTVGSDYKAGTGDNSDLTVNATLSYQFGVPLSNQLDPEKVSAKRTLVGSRHDFVDRNNFIVLEYREKDPLEVALWLKADSANEQPECVIKDTPEAGTGLEKCRWTINAMVTNRYKIVSAEWQAKSRANRILVMPVIKANAIADGNNNLWNLQLPTWENGATEKARRDLNTWQVRITLEDEKGNRINSDPVELSIQQNRKIELVAKDAADGQSDAHSHEASVLANGKDAVDLSLSLSYANGDTADSSGKPLEDDKMLPELYDVNNNKVSLSTKPCTTDKPCVFIIERNKDEGTVTIASTLSGTFRWKAKASPYGDSNYVDVTFTDNGIVELKPIIYQVNAENEGNLINKEGQLSVGQTYRFALWKDSNRDGVFQSAEKLTDEEMEQYEYKWEFTGTSKQLRKAGGESSVLNADLAIPKTNAEATSIFPNAGADGVQGYGLQVQYRKKTQ
ncbi:intimin-like inverse autotransporter SinH [Leminorella richardii]|uniref:intimin-like inverse autotransporter SinH n=1 Tax=Leminorella richardii TaxID=158841 RepID=UPI000DBE1559|nr:intimin-like inverse autotransporter SinH [Leminorella richardii]